MRKEAWVVVHCCLGKVCARCGGWWHTVLWRHGKMYLHEFKTSLFYIVSSRSVKVYIVSFWVSQGHIRRSFLKKCGGA